jgi:acetylornithine deacetylase
VPPFLPPRLEADAIHGRGTCDAKGQIVAQLAAIEGLLAEGRTGLAWLGVVGEETDSAGAIAALALAPRLPGLKVLINGEPTEGLLATGQRGLQHWRLCCEGKAAHSGSPQLGKSAAWPLLDWLGSLREVPLGADQELGPEVWNLGVLSAGNAPNVVPAHAEAQLLVRSLPGSILGERIHGLAPPEGRAELLLSEPADRYPELPGFPRAVMPFGSDAPRLRELVSNRTAVLAGPGTISVAHTDHEHLRYADLEAGIVLNRRLALHFLDL